MPRDDLRPSIPGSSCANRNQALRRRLRHFGVLDDRPSTDPSTPQISLRGRDRDAAGGSTLDLRRRSTIYVSAIVDVGPLRHLHRRPSIVTVDGIDSGSTSIDYRSTSRLRPVDRGCSTTRRSSQRPSSIPPVSEPAHSPRQRERVAGLEPCSRSLAALGTGQVSRPRTCERTVPAGSDARRPEPEHEEASAVCRPRAPSV